MEEEEVVVVVVVVVVSARVRGMRGMTACSCHYQLSTPATATTTSCALTVVGD